MAMLAELDLLPTVDARQLRSDDPSEKAQAVAALKACGVEHGFFYLTHHGIDQALIDEVLAIAQDFFARPLPDKMAYYIGQSENHSGYVPMGEEQVSPGVYDRKEAYDVNLDWREAAPRAPMLGPTQWPDDPAFRRVVGTYYAAVSKVADEVFEGFALALGLDADHFAHHRTCPPSQLRLLHYPPNPNPTAQFGDAASEVGIGDHTDYEFFTLLHGTIPGLEVFLPGRGFIDAPPMKGAFAVNIGDMLQSWTNGVFKATRHRVRKVTQDRYSLPFFATCDWWTPVAPHPAFITPERPVAYPTVISGEHLYAMTVKTFQYLQKRAAKDTQ